MGRDTAARCKYYAAHDFNPLSPHGERRETDDDWREFLEISIHSPHMGRDSGATNRTKTRSIFQSTLPTWGETLSELKYIAVTEISIHSPHMGRDKTPSAPLWRAGYFNPLSPHGERRVFRRVGRIFQGFQSTLPTWGETAIVRPLREIAPHFNPLSPHGERRRA